MIAILTLITGGAVVLAVLLIAAVLVLALEIRGQRRQISDLQQNARADGGYIADLEQTMQDYAIETARLRAGRDRKNQQITTLMRVVDGWTFAWERTGTTPPGWQEFLNPEPDLPADDVARCIDDLEQHANGGEAA